MPSHSLSSDAQLLASVHAARSIALTGALGFGAIGVISVSLQVIVSLPTFRIAKPLLLIAGQALIFGAPALLLYFVARGLSSGTISAARIARAASAALVLLIASGSVLLLGRALIALPGIWALGTVGSCALAGFICVRIWRGASALKAVRHSPILARAIALRPGFGALIGLPSIFQYQPEPPAHSTRIIAWLSTASFSTTVFLLLNLSGWLMGAANYRLLKNGVRVDFLGKIHKPLSTLEHPRIDGWACG